MRFSAMPLVGLLCLCVASAQSPEARQVEINTPYLATPPEVVTAMLKLAGVSGRDTVYDLGCGDGRIVIAAARTWGAHGVGIDINPARIDEARANARSAAVSDLVRFEVNDLFEADIRSATVVALYLLPNVNATLRPRLLRELRPGTRIVSHSFGIGDWKPEKEQVIAGERIYLWTVPQRDGASAGSGDSASISGSVHRRQSPHGRYGRSSADFTASARRTDVYGF
jgi:SAM-dependent methyltransferase